VENIIINFTSDAAGLQPGIAGMEQLTDADKAVEQQAKKSMEAYNKRDKAIADGSKTSKKSIDDLGNSMKNLDKSLVGGIGTKALADLRTSIKLTDAQWKTFYQNLIKNAKTELVSATQKQDIEQLNQLISASELALQQMAEKEDLVTKSSKSMKAQLRELKTELQQMEDAGQDNTAQFEQMAIKAGKLEDQIGDTNARIKALGSDTFVFDAMISGVTGLTGAFAAVQGAAALFGDENEDLQRALLKVNAAMSILQGLQAVQQVIQKQSAASIAIDLILRRNQTAATAAQAVAQEVETEATIAGTAAQKGLNLAFLATPTGLILTGIAAITAAIFAFGSASSTAADETEKLNESLQRQNQLLNDLSGDSFSAKLERLRLKSKGASDETLFSFDVKEEKRKLEELKVVQAAAFKERADFEAKNQQKFDDALARARKVGIDQVTIDKETKKQLEEQGKIHNDKVASANKAVEIQDEKVKLLAAERDVKIFEDSQNKKKDVAGKTAKEIREEQSKKQNEADIAAAKSAQFRTEALILQAKKGSKEELDLKLKSLDQGYLAEVLVKGNTIGQLELLDAKYYNDRQELIKQFNQKEAEESINGRIAQLNSTIALTSIDAVNESNAEILQAKKSLIDAQSDLDALSVRNSETNEELRRQKIKAIYDRALADKKALEKSKTQAEIDSLLASALSEIDRQKSKVKKGLGANPTDKETEKAFQEELRLEELAIDRKRVANFNLLANKSIDNAEFRRRENELDNAQDEIDIRREQKKQDNITRIRELAQQSAIQLTNTLFAISKANISAEEQRVREMFDAKKISETEYNNQVRQLRRKQAVDEKAQALFTTLINQGPTLLKGFQQGGIAGVAAAATLFFTLLNTLTNTAVPAFRFGGEVDGPGTGTSDSIPVRVSKGEYITRYEQTKKHKEALEAINEDRYDQYLMNHELPRLYQNMTMTAIPQFIPIEVAKGESIDYDKMADVLAAKLADNPQAVLSFDEHGFHLSIRKGNQLTEYKNKKLTT